MLWRHRFITGEWGWELPGGIVEPDEEPGTTAAREFEEETGWRPGPLRRLVAFQPMPGLVDTPHELFVGDSAERVGEPTTSDEAGVVEWVPLNRMHGLLERGELLGAGTLVGVLHLLAFKDKPKTDSCGDTDEL